MASIALVGPDGAGKSTICRMLLDSSGLKIKYLYMGISIPSSNNALPSSRLAERIKRWRRSRLRTARPAGTSAPPSTPSRSWAGSVWAAARLANRLAEEVYRQLLSWFHQARGHIVLYDRHFVYDFDERIVAFQGEPLSKRMHRWWLTHFYPRPNLVVFLDAPGTVLFARKGELNVQELERRRQAFVRQGEGARNFVRVDATQPLERVYAEVFEHIMRLHRRRHHLLASDEKLEA